MKKVIFDIYLIAGMSEDTFSPKIMVDKPYDTISTSFTWDELIKLGIQRVSSLVEFIKTKNTDLHAEIGTYGIENFCYQNVYIKKGDYLIGLLEDKELANIFVDFQSDTLEFAYLYVAGGASLHCRGYRFDVHLSREQVHAFSPHVHVYHAGDVVRYYLDTFEPFPKDRLSWEHRRDYRKHIRPFIEKNREQFMEDWNLAMKNYIPPTVDESGRQYCKES